MSIKLSPREAVKAYQVSRATLMRALANGKISAEKTSAGHWLIDPAELTRVYNPRLPQAAVRQPSPDQVNLNEMVQKVDADHDMRTRLAEAEAELKAEREKVALLQGNLDDLRRMLPPPDAKPRRWWQW